MNPFMLAALAVALAMDAFAVSCAISLALKAPTRRQVFRLASSFGLFQFVMPVAGWFAGRGLRAYIEGLDHWAAFVLLSFIGGKMIYESVVIGREKCADNGDPTCGLSLVVLSVATSIDALAVGLSLSLIGVEILSPAVVIGVVAFVLTAVGMRLGPLAGCIFGSRVEAVGGLVLIGIGVKILISHLCA